MSDAAPPVVWVVIEWAGVSMTAVTIVGVYDDVMDAQEEARKSLGRRNIVEARLHHSRTVPA